jgi:ankyrin repeat protein
MVRRDSSITFVLAGLLALCARAVLASAPLPAAQPGAANDSLEPAKAAIRLKNYSSAASILSAKAAQGDADAQYLLGALILADLVPQSDPAQAERLFETSAGKGQARAAYALAAMHAAGDQRDPVAAQHWLARAAELGDPVARDMLQRHVLPLEVRAQDSVQNEDGRRVALWRAARRNDITTLEALATPERVNASDEFGRTALHHAADAGADEAVALLLARGAKSDPVDEYRTTPLMLACATDPPAACARLLQARASVTAADRAGNAALAYAVRSHRVQQAKDLQAAGALPVRVPVVAGPSGPMDRLPRAAIDAYSGWPDVVVAASRKDPARLRELLEQRGNANAVAPGGETALLVAVESDAPQAAQLLIAAGADVSRADERGVTPLGLAVRLGHAGVVEVLLRHGADPNSHSSQERAPLVVAAENGDARTVRLLLASGAATEIKGPRGTTPLMIAAARDFGEITGLLLDAKAAPSATDSSGRSALWLAACSDSASAAALLMKAGAAVDAADQDGITPLSCAAARGNTAMTDRLIRAGANVSARARNGDTALVLAASGGHAETTKVLLAAGADANVQNHLGDTALILASQSGSVATVRVLLDGGASRKLRNRDGVAAGDVARARSFDGVVALLDR